jgi:hypothetical protein
MVVPSRHRPSSTDSEYQSRRLLPWRCILAMFPRRHIWFALPWPAAVAEAEVPRRASCAWGRGGGDHSATGAFGSKASIRRHSGDDIDDSVKKAIDDIFTSGDEGF